MEDLKDLFMLAFINATLAKGNDGPNRVKRDNHRKYFLPRVNITNHNVLVNEKNLYDHPIVDQIGQVPGQEDDYTTGCLLDYHYFLNHYQLIAFNLSKQIKLDDDPRAIQQIEFYGKNSELCTVSEKSRKTILEFNKRTAKVL